MIRVVVESPFAGKGETEEERKRNEALNVKYARACLRECLLRGEAPFASHLLYTQEGVLDDTVPEERERGINAGLALCRSCDKTALYVDLGVSGGMKYGIANAKKAGRPIEVRTLSNFRELFPDEAAP